MVRWGEQLEEAFRRRRTDSPAPQSKKRHGSAESGDPSKKIKTEVLEDDEVEEHAEDATLSKLTVAQLKGWLIKKGVHATGKKSELIEAVERKCRK